MLELPITLRPHPSELHTRRWRRGIEATPNCPHIEFDDSSDPHGLLRRSAVVVSAPSTVCAEAAAIGIPVLAARLFRDSVSEWMSRNLAGVSIWDADLEEALASLYPPVDRGGA